MSVPDTPQGRGFERGDRPRAKGDVVTDRAQPAFTFERPGQGATNDWLTPRWILDALGPFDLDPCASESDPTRCAPRCYTWRENGLVQNWGAFVWTNPPYGPHVGKCGDQ